MQIQIKRGDAVRRKSPCLVVGLHEGKHPAALAAALDRALDGALSQALRDREFSGKAGELLLIHSARRLPAQRLLCVGLGPEKGYDSAALRKGIAAIVPFLQARHIDAVTVAFDSFCSRTLTAAEAVRVVDETLRLSVYRYDAYRSAESRQNSSQLGDVLLLTAGRELAALQKAVQESAILSSAVSFARDLVNAPGNAKAPAVLAEKARAAAAEAGVRCTILDEQAIAEAGMGGVLGVAQGSARPPRFIVLEYSGAADAAPIALVGKGVVFDSGGISLKPAEKMDEMKMDMAGAAAVIATVVAAARLKLPVNLVGLVAAVENLPSGTAMRPGDILTSLSGKTIEVLNTDAEGRLTLADALTYANLYKPQAIIDVATLTGACVIALGSQATAILGNDDKLIRSLLRSGEATNERLWQLPLWDEHRQLVKSDVADLKNVAGRPAGTTTAAAFLQAFVEKTPWAHLDIAGTAWEEKGRPGVPKGGSGVGVRLLIHWLQQRAAKG